MTITTDAAVALALEYRQKSLADIRAKLYAINVDLAHLDVNDMQAHAHIIAQVAELIRDLDAR